jgi:hypothetical protein
MASARLQEARWCAFGLAASCAGRSAPPQGSPAWLERGAASKPRGLASAAGPRHLSTTEETQCNLKGMPDQQTTRGPYEILKDFQPALAAMIALTAAVMAYLAAMRKVKQDQLNLENAQKRLKLGLHLRLRYRAGRLKWHADAFESAAKVQLDSNSKDFGWFKTAVKLLPKPAPELDEAWNNLDMLPQSCYEHLEKLRADLALMTEYAESSRSEKDHRFRINTILSYCKSVSVGAANVRTIIEPEIEKLGPDKKSRWLFSLWC